MKRKNEAFHSWSRIKNFYTTKALECMVSGGLDDGENIIGIFCDAALDALACVYHNKRVIGFYEKIRALNYAKRDVAMAARIGNSPWST